MAHAYDDQNVFARILRGEIPCETVLETEHTLAFQDITPQAPVHVIVIPKGAYVSYDHFASAASNDEIVDFTRALGRICAEAKLSMAAGGNGYRLISNAGAAGGQEVPHMHVHVVGGRGLGRMLQRAE